MRRGALLITQIQRATENERTGTQDAISLEEYYQYLTDGCRFIQRQIMKSYPRRFRASTTWSADGSESYSLPTDILSPMHVVTLEYSPSGNARDYRPLEVGIQRQRWSDTGSPSIYIVEDRLLYVNAYPSTGTFRLTYYKLVPAVDKRRGTVSTHTASSTALTALTLAGYTAADFDLYDHLTVVGTDGTVKMRGIPYSSVNSGSGVVTIQGSSYTFPVGSTIANGDYYCLGEYASTHPLLDLICEDLLILYGCKRIWMRDSSEDALLHDPEILRMLGEILDVYAGTADIQPIPVTNYEFFGDLD